MSSRKKFLLSAGLLSAGVAMGMSPLTQNIRSSSGQRPDILFLLADDMGWPNASVYPQSDKVINTPTFDRVAQQGMLFNRAYTTDPSCAPSRAAMLSGQYPHRLGDAVNLWGKFPNNFPVYTSRLAKNGYQVGFGRMGWKPGNYEAGGWKHNPAGHRYDNHKKFFNELSEEESFCYWFGSHHPHRPYEKGQGVKSGMDPSKVNVPPYLPDNMISRKDICDYYYAVEQYDRQAGKIIDYLDQIDRLENTLIVMTGDNGWPFPRAKANLYDCGTHIPLAIAWGDKIKASRINNDMISLIDLAPTFLDAAGMDVPDQMNGKSLMPLLLHNGKNNYERRDALFFEREKHAYARDGNIGYPSRAVLTDDYIYIWNLRPHRWPAGEPQGSARGRPFGDVDGGPTKNYIIEKQKNMPVHPEKDGQEQYKYFTLALDKRPGEELYDLRRDPHELNNVADKSEYEQTLQKYRKILKTWMRETNDPRITGHAQFDNMPYYGPAPGKQLDGNGFGNTFGPPTREYEQ